MTMLRTLLRHVGATIAASAVLLAGIPRVEAQLSPLATDDVPGPSLLADCDVTVQHCGGYGGELYGGSELPPNVSGTTLVCANGRKTICNTTVVRTCSAWKITTISGEAEVKDLSGVEIKGEFKLTCETWTTTTMDFRWV